MPISKNRLDRDLAAYIENPEDGGTDRRVSDIKGNELLNKILGEYSSETAIDENVDMSSNYNSPTIDLSGQSKAVVRATWAGASASDATLVIEISADGSSWAQLGESGIALVDLDETQIWQFIEIPARYARIAFTANANNSGNLNLYWAGKTA